MEDFSKPLQDIDVNNEQDDDVRLIADNKAFTDFGVSLFLAFVLFAVSMVLAFVYSSSEATTVFKSNDRQMEDETTSRFSFNISSISSTQGFLYISYFFSGFSQVAEIKEAGKITFYQKIGSNVVSIFERMIEDKNLKISPINWSTTKQPIYLDHRFGYDTLQIVFEFNNLDQSVKNLELECINANKEHVLLVSSIKVVIASIFYYYTLNYCIGIFSGSLAGTYEHNITALLSLLLILYANPFSVIAIAKQNVPSDILIVVFRDLVFAYTMFYILTLFLSLLHKPNAFPVVFGSIVGIYTISRDLQRVSPNLVLYPKLVRLPDYFEIDHILVFALFLIVYVVVLVAVGKKIDDEAQNRFINYRIASMLFVLGMGIFYVLEFFGYTEGLSIRLVLPYAVFTLFGMLMNHLHTQCDTMQPMALYQDSNENANDTNPIGVEEDAEMIQANADIKAAADQI